RIVGQRFNDPRAPGATQQIYDRALDAVRRVPGVESAGFTGHLPLGGERDQYGAKFDATPTQKAEAYGVFRYAVSSGYLEATGIPLRAGRMLNERDVDGAPPVALIS